MRSGIKTVNKRLKFQKVLKQSGSRGMWKEKSDKQIYVVFSVCSDQQEVQL